MPAKKTTKKPAKKAPVEVVEIVTPRADAPIKVADLVVAMHSGGQDHLVSALRKLDREAINTLAAYYGV